MDSTGQGSEWAGGVCDTTIAFPLQGQSKTAWGTVGAGGRCRHPTAHKAAPPKESMTLQCLLRAQQTPRPQAAEHGAPLRPAPWLLKWLGTNQPTTARGRRTATKDDNKV